MIVLEGARKLPFFLRKPALNLALERGMHFEFSYAPAIRDAGAARRYLFANVLALLRLTRGRNLVLSSAAAREIELRAPWDVINLSATITYTCTCARAFMTQLKQHLPSSHARNICICTFHCLHALISLRADVCCVRAAA